MIEPIINTFLKGAVLSLDNWAEVKMDINTNEKRMTNPKAGYELMA
ncbi:MAG: hypothetical protein PUB19_08930 [Lachnospiraceae bacterium]|nr:hypothetical protein [Lachnospiraceae bacterium]